MGGAKTIQKNFNQFRGKDLRSSDLVRDINSAIDFRNLNLQKDSSIATREGGKILADSGQYLGLFNYTYSNTTTGATEEEIVSLSNKLYKRASNTFTVTYAGSANPVVFNLSLDTTNEEFYVTIIEGTITKLSYSLGTGLEASPIDLADLKTAIDAISGGNFSATISGSTGVPAAFLPITIYQDLASSPKTVIMTYYTWTAVNSTVTTTFSDYYSARGGDAFEHASFCNYQDCLFIATGYEYLHKYDGQTVYRAGMPEPTAAPTLADTGAGNVDTGDHSYIYWYKQKIIGGNITEGVPSEVETITLAGASPVDVTVNNIQASSGFNTNYAQVNGLQGLVTTITVDSGYTIKVGDTAYFYDTNTSAYVERAVTALPSATQITIAGGAVSVADNTPISNNLRIVIARTKVGGTDYFILNEIANNASAATQVYADNVADANITGAQYITPFKAHDILSVKPRYITTHQNLLIADGGFAEPNTVYYSYIEDRESFPLASNNFDVPSSQGGGVSGLVSDETNLIIGKRKSLFTVSGDLEEGTFRVDKINEGTIGIDCHNASADIGNGVMILSDGGFFVIQGGVNVIELGFPINKIFFDPVYDEAQEFILRRGFGVYDDNQERYFCFLPCESGSGTSKYANDNSRVFVYDSYMRGWNDYDSLNMGGGICVNDGQLWWQSKRDDSSLTVTGNLFKQHNSGTENDYADHASVINVKFGSQWIDGENPRINKFIPRFSIYNLSTSILQTAFIITVTTELNYLYGLTDSQVLYSFDNGNSSGGWGYFPWGIGAWGSPTARLPQAKKLKNSKFKSLRFVFSHGELHQRMALTGWDYELVASYREEMAGV